MENGQRKPAWRCSASIRICHSDLDPTEVSRILDSTPQIAQRAGESKVPYGDSKSAGYWCLVHEVEAPDRPDSALLWAEEFVREHESQLQCLLDDGFDVDVYIGIHSAVLALGFELPAMLTICKHRIRVGIEFFSC